MSRRSLSRQPVEEAVDMMDADWLAREFLAKLPKQVGIVTAIKTAAALAELWEMEKEELIRRGDQEYYFLRTKEERCWVAWAVAKCSKSSLWRQCSIEEARMPFANLSPDAAAWVSFRVARSVSYGEEF
jgi:hypothetical protein